MEGKSENLSKRHMMNKKMRMWMFCDCSLLRGSMFCSCKNNYFQKSADIDIPILYWCFFSVFKHLQLTITSGNNIYTCQHFLIHRNLNFFYAMLNLHPPSSFNLFINILCAAWNMHTRPDKEIDLFRKSTYFIFLDGNWMFPW